VVNAGSESGADRTKRHHQRNLFDGIAAQYEAFRPGYPAQVVDFVIATAGLGAESAVLEIGCGTGQLTERLAAAGLRVTAIDIGASMVAAARQRVSGGAVSFEVTSFEELAASLASFDLVISATAFHWIDPEVAFSKSARLLRQGGWLALLGTDERYDDPLGAAMFDLWIAHGDTGGAWDRRPSDPEAVSGTGLFGVPECLAVSEQSVQAASDVVGLASTRGTFLSWPHDSQSDFAADLRQLLDSQPAVHVTRQTSVTMAPVLP
jgi:ubiquinone/menaquinone biosynthesis C-methylase UbiE